MFRVSQHTSSVVSKTVPAASGTGHATCTATPLLRGLVWTSLYESSRQHPSSGVSKTVPAASGTGHITCTATPLLRGLIGTIRPDQTT